MVVFDANFLIYFLDPKIKGGVGSNPRIDCLVATIQKTGEYRGANTSVERAAGEGWRCRTEVLGDCCALEVLPCCGVR